MAKERDDQNQPQHEGEAHTPPAQPPAAHEDAVNLGDLPPESGAPRTDSPRKPTTQLAKPEATEEHAAAAEPPAKGPAPDTMIFTPAQTAPPAPPPTPVPNLSLDQPYETVLPPADVPPPASPPPLPNLSLDEPDQPIVAQPVAPGEVGSHVLQAEPVGAAGGSSVIDAVPLDEAKPPSSSTAKSDSDVFLGEFAEPHGEGKAAAGDSDVFEAQPASGGESGVIEADLVEEASGAKGQKPGSDIGALEEAEEVTGGGSAIFQAEPASSIFEAEPVSSVNADDVLGEVEEVLPGEEVESSEIVAAEVASDDETSSATRREESVLGEADMVGSHSGSGVRPGQPESPVVFEEDVVEAAEAGDSGAVRAEHADDEETEEASVFDAEEVAAVGSSSVEAESSDVMAAEVVDEDDEDALAGHVIGGDEDDSSAVDLGKSHSAKNGPSASGIDPVAEALESGVNLDDDALAAKGTDEPSVEFDELLTEDASKVAPKGSKKKPADEDVFEAAEAATDEEDIFGEDEGVLAAEAASDDEAEAVEAAEVDEDEEALEAVEAEEGEELEAALADEDEGAEEAALVDEDEAEAAAVVDEDEEAEAAAVVDEDEAEVTFGSEEAEATTDFDVEDQPIKGRKSRALAAEMDEDEAAAVVDEDEEPALAEDEEEGELVGAGAGAGGRGKKRAAAAEPGPRPRRAVPWLGGTLLGMFLALVAGAGVWYFSPTSVQQLQALHPDFKAPPPPLPAATPLQKATEQLAVGNYDQVISQLSGRSTPTELTALGEARWLKYVKEQAAKKAPLKADDPEVKQARADLSKAGENNLVLQQIDKTLEADKLAQQVAALAGTEKALTAVRDELVKAKVADEGAKPEDLPKAIGQVVSDKQEADKVREGIGQALADAKLIDDKKSLDVPTFQKVLKDLGDQKATAVAVNKLLEGANIKDGGAKGVQELLAARKDADDKLTEVNKALADAKLKDPGAKGVQELLEARAKLEKDRDELAAAVKSAVEELADAKLVTPGADPRKDLVAGTKQARQRAESPLAVPLLHLGGSLAGLGTSVGQLIESGMASARVAGELGYYRLREPLIVTPEQHLETHIAALQDRDRKEAATITAVLRQAEWLLSKDAGASPEARGKAHYAAGLAQRNQENYAAARKSLEAAVKEARALAKPGPWAQQAAQTLKELDDPAAYYGPRIARAMAAGDTAQALAEVDRARKVMPERGQLRVEQALIELEDARRQGKVVEMQKQIRADAEAGRKDAPAPAAYVLGQLEEDLGNYEAAEDLYRQAIQANQAAKGPALDGYRYRIALARVLQRERSAAGAAAPEPAEPRKDEKADKAEEKTSAVQPAEYHPLAGLVLAAVIGAQPGEEEESPKMKARLDESVKLAEELIQSDDPKIKGEGHILLGQALSKRGKRTEGLREVAIGLKLMFPGIPAQELNKLLSEHPAFQHPDVAKEPNPDVAEKFFGLALHHYWEGRFAEAEAQLKQAVGYFDQDARYQYFLGLAQLAQGTKLKRDQAYYSFEKGARLEAAGRPGVAEVNGSLERVQGNLRQLLNDFRIRVLTKNLPE